MLQMKAVQRGYTLIEILIVVTIIGILSAIAVPAYQDYSVRARVAEAASLSGLAKTAVDVAWSEGYLLGSMPGQSTLGLAPSGSYNSKYVSGVSVDAAGVVTIRLTGEASLNDAANGIVQLTPSAQGGNLSWTSSCSFSLRYCPPPGN